MKNHGTTRATNKYMPSTREANKKQGQEQNGEQLLYTAYKQAPGREYNADSPSVEAGLTNA